MSRGAIVALLFLGIVGTSLLVPNSLPTKSDDTIFDDGQSKSVPAYRISNTQQKRLISLGIPGIYFLAFEEMPSLQFHPQGTTITQILSGTKYELAVNAGFFAIHDENGTNTFSHAGGLVLSGVWQYPYASNDSNISHTLTRDNTGSVRIFSNNTYDSSTIDKQTTMMQTGPVILSGGVLSDNLMTIPVAQKKTLRTVLIINDEQMLGVVISLMPIRLSDLAIRIKQSTLFAGETITAIGLDGGLSVAYGFQTDQGVQGWNVHKSLPAFLVFSSS